MKRFPWAPAVLLVVAVMVASRLSPNFLDARYLLDTTSLYVETGLLALAMTVVIVTGNIDLSVGSMLVLVACIIAKLMAAGLPIAVAVLLACVLGSALGLVNGLLIAGLRLPSFLVTLGTMAAYRGAAQAMMGATSVKLPAEFKGIDRATVFGLPWPFMILCVFVMLFALMLHRTVFGRWCFAVGTNASAARYSGISTFRVTVTTFALTGLMAGIGALLIDSRLAVARHDLARGIELDAITVAVVGGASIAGGKGSIIGTTLALFLVLVVKAAMGVASVKPEYQLTAIGAMLIVAVLADRLAEILRRKRSMKPARS